MDELLALDRKARTASVGERRAVYAEAVRILRGAPDATLAGAALLRLVDWFCAPCVNLPLEDVALARATAYLRRAAIDALGGAAGAGSLSGAGRAGRVHGEEAVRALRAAAERDAGALGDVLAMLAALLRHAEVTRTADAVAVYLCAAGLESDDDAAFGAALGLAGALGARPVLIETALRMCASGGARAAQLLSLLPPPLLDHVSSLSTST